MPLRLPVAGGGPPHEPPPYGGLGENGWSRGRTFLELIETAGAAGRRLEEAFAAVVLPANLQAFFSGYGRRVRVLALADLAQAETLAPVAQAERLFSFGKRIWMRTFLAPEHPDLVTLFAATALPLFVFFGDDKREFGRWSPPPRASRQSEPGGTRREAEAAPARAEAPDQGASMAEALREILQRS